MTAAQDDADCFYGIADLHALRVRHDPTSVRTHTTEMAALLLAVGLDRMIQFKEKGRGVARPASHCSPTPL